MTETITRIPVRRTARTEAEQATDDAERALSDAVDSYPDGAQAAADLLALAAVHAQLANAARTADLTAAIMHLAEVTAAGHAVIADKFDELTEATESVMTTIDDVAENIHAALPWLRRWWINRRIARNYRREMAGMDAGTAGEG